MNNTEDQVRIFRELREKCGPNDSKRWILLIKELRATHNCSIDEAERIALTDRTWKRWVERQINSNQDCAKTARTHIHRHGEGALIVEEAGKLKVR